MMFFTSLISVNRYWKQRIQKINCELNLSSKKFFNYFADAYQPWRVDQRAYRQDFRGIELQDAALSG